MNVKIKIFFVTVLSIFLSSCCHDVSKENMKDSESSKITKNPASLTINKSIVTARIEGVEFSDDGSFAIKAYIINVEEDPSYPGMAITGKTYSLIPNFRLDEEKNIITESEINKNLNLLSKKSIGTEFEASIFFDKSNGWFIQEVIKN